MKKVEIYKIWKYKIIFDSVLVELQCLYDKEMNNYLCNNKDYLEAFGDTEKQIINKFKTIIDRHLN